MFSLELQELELFMLPPSIRQLLHLVSQSLTYLCACAAGKYMAGRGTWYGICQRVHVITFYDAGWMMRPSVAVVVDIGHHFRFHNIRGRGDGGVRSLACDGSGCEGVRPVCHCRLPRLAVGADCLRQPLYPLAVWTNEKRSYVAFTAFSYT